MLSETLRAGAFSVLVVSVLCWSTTQVALGSGSDEKNKRVSLGQELFTHEWVPGDNFSHAGDGLGPVYNATSCAACHRLGGIGGAGTNDTNAVLVTAFVSKRRRGRMVVGRPIEETPLPAEATRKEGIRSPDQKPQFAIPDRNKLAEIHPLLRRTISRRLTFGALPS
jgi:hypothetical protein